MAKDMAPDVASTDALTVTRVDNLDGVAVLTLHAPPGNALSPVLRTEIMTQMTRLIADDTVTGIVLTGGPKAFSLGLDIRTLDHPSGDAPQMDAVCNLIAASPKPVVAAIEGAALGSGLELALSCHARIAAPEARMGFPELVFGLIPGAGGTQRLPRLIGAARALALLVTPRQYPANAPEMAGLFHAITPHPVPAAIALLRATPSFTRPDDRSDGFADPTDYIAAVTAARNAPATIASVAPATRIVDCVEAALLLPPAQGRAFERVAHEDCLASDDLHGLLHAHFAERRAVNMPELVGQKIQAPDTIGVVGGGPAAAGIVAAALAAGLQVIQFERNAEALADAAARLAALPDPPSGAARLRLLPTSDLRLLANAGLVIEAVAEAPQTKAQVFAALAEATRPGTVLATNSLLQAIAPMAQASRRPVDVLALHFHGPAQTNPLAEIVISRATSPAALARAVGLAQALGKHPVRSAGGAGGIGERMQAALRDALAGMIQIGVSPAAIDAALLDYGFAHAPLAGLDRIGLDLALSRGGLLARDGVRVPQAHLMLLRRLVEDGRKGRAVELGFYRWHGEVAHHDPRLRGLLPATAQSDPGLDPAEIVLRALAALANEGARLLRAEIALRPSDIDMIMVLGYGFPRGRGGPMKAADMVGMFEISRLLRRLAETDPVLYDPDPGFAALAKNGETFDALNKLGRHRRRIPD